VRGAAAKALRTRPAAVIEIRVCPSCRRRHSGIAHGYLHITGEFLPAHRAEMEVLLHHEVEQATQDNSFQQILEWKDDGAGGLLITSATEDLAQRLGRALEKAFGGYVHYGFSDEKKLAHVWWHR
jgi:hypothetical protein